MKSTLNILILTFIFFTNFSCKKKVVPPNNEANGKEIIYIEVEGKKYLFQQNYKFYTSKSQRGNYTDYQQASLFQYTADTILTGYKLYDFNIQIDSYKENLFFGGFDLQVWHKDSQSPTYIKRFNTDRFLPNPTNNWKNGWVKILKFDYFKFNELKQNKEKQYLNFEASYQFSDSLNAPKTYRAYWKGDVLVNTNF
jgi:hypothetical protein